MPQHTMMFYTVLCFQLRGDPFLLFKHHSAPNATKAGPDITPIQHPRGERGAWPYLPTSETDALLAERE